MMSTSNESSIMENSTILRDIAEFDTEAPISVTITFDDDSNEAIVKKEILTEDSQEEGAEETIVSAFFPVLESEPDIQAQKLDSCSPVVNTEKKQSGDFSGQNSYQEFAAREPDNLKDNLLDSYISRKRKTENLEMCKPKQFKAVSDYTQDGNNYAKENSLASPTNQTSRNIIQANSSTSPSDCGNTNSGATSENQFNLSSYLKGVDQQEKNKIRTIILDHLSTLSEYMHRIMQAFDSHRQQHISNDEYKKIKYKYFNLSHKILIKIMLPEERNNTFITAFVYETLKRARKKCGPYYTHTYHDYANLLLEMRTWAKVTQQPIQSAEESEPPTTQNGATVESEINKHLVQNSIPVNNLNQNAATDKVCIFSAGPPERALSINIDPNFKKYVQNSSNATNRLIETKENKPQNSENHNTAAPNILTTFVTNSIPSSTIQHRPLITQPAASLISNAAIATTQIELHPAMPSNPHRYSTSNITNDIILTHLGTPAPLLQSQLRKPPLPGYLQQPPPSYQHSLHFRAQPNQQQATLPIEQSLRLLEQSIQQTKMPSQYNPAQLSESQLNAPQFPQAQYLQAQTGSQYGQAWPLQGQLGQSSMLMPHKQPGQVQSGQSHQDQYTHQLQQYPKESWPTMEELLSMGSTPQLPYQSSNEQYRSPGQWQPNQLHQAQPLPAYGTERHQGPVYQEQAPQTKKGSPRTASTDSGFISPLNFNMSTEQTMPSTPHEPETSLPMIVHVTSLSDKAAFVEIGKCVVCKKSTKQMCMGCMNIYYCNYQCQSQDWTTHAPHCSQQKRNYMS